MEHDLVVEGRVVLPGSFEPAQIGITDGVIAEVRKQGLKGVRTIHAGDGIVFPGFIDCHVHLRDPGWPEKEDFGTGSRAAVHGGVTTAFDMPNNPVPANTASALRDKQERAKERSVIDIRFFAGVDPNDIPGIRDVSGLAVGYKVYMSETTGTSPFPEASLGAALRLIAETGKPVSAHCEKQELLAAKLSLAGGSPEEYPDARPPSAEMESVETVLAASKKAGVRVNICHVSTAGALEKVSKAAASGADAACEVTLHHLFFTRRALSGNAMLRTNPPLREESDRVAVLNGLKAGTVKFLATDHAPHTKEEKATSSIAGVPGLDDYGHMVSWLIRNHDVHPLSIARMTSGNQAGFFSLRDRGTLASGMRADITVLDMTPEVVRSGSIMSKCGWSPYEGVEFPGRVRWVISRGSPVLEDYQVS